MWIKKQPERIVAEQSALYRKMTALIVFFGLSFADYFFAPSNLQPSLSVKTLLTLAGLACFVILFRRWRADRTRSVAICESCGSAKADDGNMKCSCNGRFIPLAQMEWVEPSRTRNFNMKTCQGN